jgi:hypothetical protein
VSPGGAWVACGAVTLMFGACVGVGAGNGSICGGDGGIGPGMMGPGGAGGCATALLNPQLMNNVPSIITQIFRMEVPFSLMQDLSHVVGKQSMACTVRLAILPTMVIVFPPTRYGPRPGEKTPISPPPPETFLNELALRTPFALRTSFAPGTFGKTNKSLPAPARRCFSGRFRTGRAD